MKIASPRGYNLEEILKTKSGNDLKTFVEYVATTLDKVLQMSQNKIELADNINSETKTIQVRTINSRQEIIKLRGKPTGMLAPRVINDIKFTTYVTSCSWAYSAQDGKVYVNVVCNQAPPTPLEIELTFLY